MGGVSNTCVVVTGSRMGAVVTGLIEIGSASGWLVGCSFLRRHVSSPCWEAASVSRLHQRPVIRGDGCTRRGG